MKITCNLEQKYSKEIELNAAIQLKNYINSNWKFTNDHNHNQQLIIEDDDIIIVISNEDKEYIKNNIVDSLIYFVTKENVKVLKQLNQCIKKGEDVALTYSTFAKANYETMKLLKK